MAINQSITAKPGFQFLFQVADPTVSPTAFVVVGGLRNTSLTINNNPADITNAASNGLREFLPDGGIQEFSLTADGVYDSKTTGAKLVATSAVQRKLIEGRIVSGHGDSFVGTFVISSITRTGNFQEAETFNISIQGAGQIVYVPGP